MSQNVVLMLEILRTVFSRSINAACSGMLCRAVLFQGFVVTRIWDAYHISLVLKRIIVKTKGRFL